MTLTDREAGAEIVPRPWLRRRSSQASEQGWRDSCRRWLMSEMI